MKPLNLQQLFGKKYKVVWEENQDRPSRKDAVDAAWYFEIPCKYGTIYPYNYEYLAAYARTANKKNALLKGGWAPVQLGDSECTVLFRPEEMDAVDSILLARKRKQLSDESRAAIAARLTAVRSRR